MTTVPTLSVEQLQRLPKWACDHIALLELRLGEARRQFEEVVNVSTPTSVQVNPHAEQPYYLPDGTTVRFFPPALFPDPSTGINVRLRSGVSGIELLGDDVLAVYPISGNEVLVESGES